MKYPRSIFRKTPSSLAFHEQRSRELRYVWAVTLVALGLLVGFVMQPGFGRSQAYATFYPVVFVAAATLGPRPAAMTTILSAGVAYWCFIPPAFQWKWDLEVGSALAFFLGGSAVAICLISRITQIIVDRAERRPSAATLARVNSVIFADLAAREPRAGGTVFTPQRSVLIPARSPVRPSARSFDSARPELNESGDEKASSRQAGAVPDERAATLH